MIEPKDQTARVEADMANDARLETTKRRALAGFGAGLGVLAGISAPVQAQTATKTFVLVHGSWHGGWCWRRVADLLEENGHKVYTPTLTGLQRFPVNLNLEDSQSVTDEQVCRH